MRPNLPTLSLISGISCGKIDDDFSSFFMHCSCSVGVGATNGIGGGLGGNSYFFFVGLMICWLLLIGVGFGLFVNSDLIGSRRGVGIQSAMSVN
jgi:hypothetical protein